MPTILQILGWRLFFYLNILKRHGMNFKEKNNLHSIPVRIWHTLAFAIWRYFYWWVIGKYSQTWNFTLTGITKTKACPPNIRIFMASAINWLLLRGAANLFSSSVTKEGSVMFNLTISVLIISPLSYHNHINTHNYSAHINWDRFALINWDVGSQQNRSRKHFFFSK